MIYGTPIETEGYSQSNILKEFYTLFETILDYWRFDTKHTIERIDLDGDMVNIIANGVCYFDNINIDSLTRVCKEWIVSQSYILVIQHEPDQTIVKLFQDGEEITFRGDEFESLAVFKIGNIVLKELSSQPANLNENADDIFSDSVLSEIEELVTQISDKLSVFKKIP